MEGCVNKGKSEHFPDPVSLHEIDLQSVDITKDGIQDILELESYVRLSDEVPLGRVERILIFDEKIYILDNEPKIVCFDMSGKVRFKIDDRGPGPKEYANIEDIGIDRKTKKLIALDDAKRKLFFYDLSSGKYISDLSANYMAPTEFGVSNGTYFFKNIDHSRFKEQKDQLYYLLYSETGKKVDKMFLPHDAVADYSFDMPSFFYNDNKLLYITPFNETVYMLNAGEIVPLYKIMIPNHLPMKMIEAKMGHHDIVSSNYAYGLGNVFEADQILYFIFSKDGFIVSNFYDLSENKLLYCGVRVLESAKKNLPFYSLIDGVYKDRFFALVPSFNIQDATALHPEYCPKDLLQIQNDDNGVIAFYIIKKP
jgi:hypothetical protein